MLHRVFSVDSPRRRFSKAMQALAVALPIVAFSGAACAGTSVPGDANPSNPACKIQASTVASWFESGSVTANGAVKPADSLHFPDQPNCSFYAWSEQMFLWLTSPTSGGYSGGAHIFDSNGFYDVSIADSTTGQRTFIEHTPNFIRGFGLRMPRPAPSQGSIIVDKTGRKFVVSVPETSAHGKQLILNRQGRNVEIGSVRVRNNKVLFLDNRGKIIPHNLPKLSVKAIKAMPRLAPMNRRALQFPVAHRFIGPNGLPIFVDSAGNVLHVEQSQATGDVLMAQNGSVVYYLIETNDVFTYFLTGAKDGAITPTPTQFPTNSTDLAKITGFGSAHGKTFPDANALAVVIKTAWVEATGLDTSKYITIRATVPTYDKTNPDHWIPNGQKQVVLALVGMHVVGSTGSQATSTGHPEMIWATFEHVDNTPNAPYSYQSTAASGTSNGPNDAGPWLFSSNSAATAVNVSHIEFNPSNSGLDAKCDPVTHVCQHIGPSDTQRTKPWGMLGSNTFSNAEIIAANHGVLSSLAAGDIRKNYVLVGATWTPFGQVPVGTNSVGTNQLANTTMETYSQGNATTANGANCFGCHQAFVSGGVVQSNSMLGTDFGDGLSHVWGPLRPLF